MPNITTKDLHIFRGTKDECLTQKTEDMKIYLAWDTHEIFIGNAQGKKVKYGGSKDILPIIAEEFEKFRILLHSEVTSAIDNLSGEKVSQYINEYDASLQQRITDLATKVNQDVDRLKAYFDEIMNETTSSINSKLDEFNRSVEVLANIDLVSLATAVTDIIDRVNELSDIATIEFVNNKISLLNSSISNTYYNITQIDNKLQEINSILSALPDLVSSNSDNITVLDTKIDNKVSELTNSINLKANTEDVYTKEELADVISNSVNCLRYMSGNEISKEYIQLSRNNELNTFKPVFCISSYSNYNIGSIYYYDPDDNTIVETSSGNGSGGSGTGLQVIDAGISQKLYLYNSISVSATSTLYTAGPGETSTNNLEVSSTQKRYVVQITIERPEALKELYINGSIIPYSKWHSGTYVHDSILFTPNNVSNIISSEVTVVAQDSTNNIRYTATGNSIIFNILQPTLFGNSNNFANVGLAATGRFTASITANQTVYLLTRTEISRITSSGFEVPYVMTSQTPVLLSEAVNGVTGLYYYQYSLGNINDTTMTINVE